MKPLLTVVLPVYNAGKTIRKAISSILNQTFKEFELIIINDGSTDDTLSAIRSFNDDRIRLYSTPNRGVAKAANFAMKLAQTNLIARMDADDEALLDRLQLQYGYLQHNTDVEVVSGLVQYGGNRLKNLGYALHVDRINELITHEQMFNRRFEDLPVANPSVMFCKSLIEKFGGYNEMNVPEDYELFLRWMSMGVKFSKLNHNLLIWNDLETRITRTHSDYSEANFDQTKALYLTNYLKNTYKTIPELWVWGAGRKVNSKVKLLRNLGLRITLNIDVKQQETRGNVMHYSQIKSPGNYIILSYVKDRKGKQEIINYLNSRGFEEGKNYFLMN
ncbi:MAG: glycosyltransferase [Fulvivirga sp.]|uniref:glycosyltransferase family 2 protein n=1 Tax=Fulvivirga sp. TaxID=1931237 RepID=UPI0032EE5146